MRRLYFLIPEIGTVREIVNELLLARIEERRIHVIAKRDMVLEDIPQANIVHMSDLVPAIGRGIMFGGFAGFMTGVCLVNLMDTSFAQTGGLVTLLVTIGGAGFGAWISGMVGISVPNSRIKQFQHAIESGYLLMLIDVPTLRMDDITQKVSKQHPEVRFGGIEPDIPAFP